MGAALTGCWPAAPDGPSPLPLQKALFITYWKLPSSRSLVSLVTEKFFH